MDWESQDDGYIAKLLVPDGAKDIAVGDPVAVFVEDKAIPVPVPASCVLFATLGFQVNQDGSPVGVLLTNVYKSDGPSKGGALVG